jgi:hypothetical protein
MEEMKSKKLVILFVVLVLVLGIFGNISTGQARLSENAYKSVVYPPSMQFNGTSYEIEEFRAELMEHYDDLEALYPYIAKAVPPGFLERLNQARERATEMTLEDLEVIREAFTQHPILTAGPGQLLAFFEAQDQVHAFSIQSLDSCPALLPDDWCGCPSGVPGGLSDVYIAKGVAQGLEIVATFVPQDYVFGAIVLGEGVVSTVYAHPAKMALHGAYELAKSAALIVEGIYAVNDACHQGYHRALLVEHDEYVRWMLDNVVEHRKVYLQVIELVEKREFMVSATKAGSPLTGVEFTAVRFSTMNDPDTFIDVTGDMNVDMVADGVYMVTLGMQVGNGAPRIFIFEVKHNNGFVDHYGFTMFDRIGPRNMGGGK